MVAVVERWTGLHRPIVEGDLRAQLNRVELRTAIRETLVGFSLKDTGLAGKMSQDATKLVPVDYKKDWDSARQIDKLAAEYKAQGKIVKTGRGLVE